jgi:hypothetical protein
MFKHLYLGDESPLEQFLDEPGGILLCVYCKVSNRHSNRTATLNNRWFPLIREYNMGLVFMGNHISMETTQLGRLVNKRSCPFTLEVIILVRLMVFTKLLSTAIMLTLVAMEQIIRIFIDCFCSIFVGNDVLWYCLHVQFRSCCNKILNYCLI